MTVEEHRRHHRQSDEPTIEDIYLNDNNATCPSTNNSNTIEETAVVHSQPVSQEIVELDSDDQEDSSSSCNSEDENKHNLVAKRLPELTIENKVTNSERTTITNNHKTVIQAPSVVINKNFYTNSLAHADNLDRIDVVPPGKKITIDKNPDTNVEPNLSDTPSQSLCTQNKDTRWYTQKRLITISGAVLAGLAVIGIIVYFLIPVPTFDDVRIVPRVEWLAQPASEDAKPLAVLPAKYVIIIHTRTANCFTQPLCSRVVRELQRRDMEVLKMTDIAYNWLVGGDGLVYKCRGWDVEGDHTKNYDNKSIGIGFIGLFKKEEPSKDQIEMGKKLIRKGVEEKHISEDYILVGQKQCLQTSSESPGEKLYEIINKWDNWSPACFSL